jgi:methionyl-tRNA formyltransferase
VADYGLILPKSLLALPIYAPINVHHSLLPKYRGPSPAPSAILGGEKISGVSIIFMTDKVDAGDILKQTSYTLKPDETTDSLLTELNILGSKAIIEVIEQYLAGNIISKKQDEAKATYTTYMKKTDALINLSEDPALNWRKIRAYGKWPGTYFITKKKGKDLKVKIAKAKYDEGTLTIERIIPENGKEMAYDDFLRGLRK